MELVLTIELFNKPIYIMDYMIYRKLARDYSLYDIIYDL